MNRINQVIENKDRISSAFNLVLREGIVHFFCLNTKETEPKKKSRLIQLWNQDMRKDQVRPDDFLHSTSRTFRSYYAFYCISQPKLNRPE